MFLGRYMIFIDTNLGYVEVQNLIFSSCMRGQRFMQLLSYMKQPCTFSSGLLFLHSVLITGTLASLELSTQQHPTLSSVAALGKLARFRIRGAASEPAIVFCVQCV